MRKVHAFSIDVEEWTSGTLEMWFGTQSPPRRAVLENSLRILDLLGRHGSRATWFFLGDVVSEFPGLVRRVVEAGHEVGVHGLKHVPVREQRPAAFKADLAQVREMVEQAGGARVLGHRAPTFSMDRSMHWAFEALAECGFTYDSSIYPFRGGRYGDPTAPLEPWEIQTPSGRILEVPLTVVTVAGRRYPVCGGGYLRHFPLAVTLAAMKRLETEGRKALFYMHPYEIQTVCELGRPENRLPWPASLRFRAWKHLQYRERGRTMEKLRTLASRLAFSSVANVFVESETATEPDRSTSLEPRTKGAGNVADGDPGRGPAA